MPIASALAVGDRRAQIQRQMELVMGSNFRIANGVLHLDVQVISVEKLDKYTRIKLTYAPEPGRSCANLAAHSARSIDGN